MKTRKQVLGKINELRSSVMALRKKAWRWYFLLIAFPVITVLTPFAGAFLSVVFQQDDFGRWGAVAFTVELLVLLPFLLVASRLYRKSKKLIVYRSNIYKEMEDALEVVVLPNARRIIENDLDELIMERAKMGFSKSIFADENEKNYDAYYQARIQALTWIISPDVVGRDRE